MKISIFKRSMALFLAFLLCVSVFAGSAVLQADASGVEAEVRFTSFPRVGDANFDANWGHGDLHFMNGWEEEATSYLVIRAVGSYDGAVCYCIEPGVYLSNNNTLTQKDESFWDNYVFLETSNEIGIVRKGETGYYRTNLATSNRDENRELVKELNEKAGLTQGQVEAMKSGSMFGWQLPAADPKNYDEQGHPIKPKRHDRGDAR